jgi:hypothetical protein
VARGVVATIDRTCVVRAVDVGKMIKAQYEAATNLSLLAAFVAFVAFLSHIIIGKE